LFKINNGSIFILILIGLALIALQTYLIQVIWNKVIIKKFPESNIQTLTFWDALVFFSLIGISRNIQIGNKQ
jgi:hypothetical protein